MGFNPAGGAISGATDVALSNPANNQALVYDTSVAKWKNGSVAASVSVGIQIWTGTNGTGSWSARPSGHTYVEAFSDGTAGSSRDPSAPAPTGSQNGDRWWDALT